MILHLSTLAVERKKDVSGEPRSRSWGATSCYRAPRWCLFFANLTLQQHDATAKRSGRGSQAVPPIDTMMTRLSLVLEPTTFPFLSFVKR